jgi:hypothetical protein
MFRWNGTDVSNIIKDAEIREGRGEKRKYWNVILGENVETVIVKNSSHTVACLMDELKPVFGLEKIGTHWVKLHGKIYILFRPERDRDGQILEELTLDDYKYDKAIVREVQKIFLFREILGVTQNMEKNVILRIRGLYIQPLSFYESNLKPSQAGKVLSNIILDKWFKDVDLDQAVADFFHITSIEEINGILLPLRQHLEEVVDRTDPSSIMYVDEICSRIRSRLQSSLTFEKDEKIERDGINEFEKDEFEKNEEKEEGV